MIPKQKCGFWLIVQRKEFAKKSQGLSIREFDLRRSGKGEEVKAIARTGAWSGCTLQEPSRSEGIQRLTNQNEKMEVSPVILAPRVILAHSSSVESTPLGL